MLAAWLHDLNPFLVRFSEGFGVRWYGLAYALGFVIAWLLVRWLAKIRFTPIPAERAGDVILIWVIGVIAGGRLGYVLVYQPSLLWTFGPRPPWWGLLALNDGGMASHGGIAGVMVASWFIARGLRNSQGVRVRVPARHVLDISAMAVPFGMFLGRAANFINGELLGAVVSRPGERAPWWAVRYPQELSEEYMLRVDPAHLPVQTDAQWDAVLAILDRFGRAERGFDYAYHRMMERLQGGDGALARELTPLISARHPSQLYQAAAEGVVLGMVLWWIARRPRLPGVIGAWFMITYGVLRIVTEFWRLPDSHLAVQRWMGLSRGQWLSAGMILVGAGALVWIRRVGGERMGGWLECLRGDRGKRA